MIYEIIETISFIFIGVIVLFLSILISAIVFIGLSFITDNHFIIVGITVFTMLFINIWGIIRIAKSI